MKDLNFKTSLVHLLSAVAVAVAAVGCDAEDSAPLAVDEAVDDSNDIPFVAASATDDDAIRPVDATGAILDEIDLGDGASVRFIDERVSVAAGGIGVLARGIPRFQAAVSALDLTPLELYLALAPAKQAPARLYEDHEATSDRAPRAFRLDESGALAPLVGDLTNPTPEPLLAQDVGTLHITETCYAWSQDYCPDIAANQGGYDWCSSGQVTSASVYAYTGTAGQRWLGAASCVERFDWEVQMEFTAGVWSFVSGTDIGLTANMWVSYTSSTLAVNNYRSKIVVTSTSPYNYYVTAARD